MHSNNKRSIFVSAVHCLMFSLLMNDFFTYEATSQVVNKAIISNYHIPSEKFSYQNTVHSQRQKKKVKI